MLKNNQFNNVNQNGAGNGNRNFVKKHMHAVKAAFFAVAAVICGSIYYLSGYGAGQWSELPNNDNGAGQSTVYGGYDASGQTRDAGGSSDGHDTDDQGSQSAQDNYIYVYVCGSVINPGVYEVYAGARVHELIALAGGLSEDAYAQSVSMAKPVNDGQTLYVPSVSDAEQGRYSRVPAEAGDGDGISGRNTKININTASVEQLMTLKGIGESRAKDIVDYRTRNGSFKKTEDVMKVSGIKEAAYSKIKDDICVK